MKPHEQGLLNQIGKVLAKSLSALAGNRRAADALRNVDAYVCILLGKGAGTGWAIDAETSAARRFIRRPDPVLFDIGANAGNWSALMTTTYPAARVFMFEPQATCHELIRRAIPDAVLIPKAVSSSSAGRAQFYVSGDADCLGSFHERRDSYFDQLQFAPIDVATTTIDEVIAEHRIDRVDFMKMDIEGHELAALEGARRSLEARTIRALSFEFGSANINSRTFFHDFWDLLTPLGYRIFRVLPSAKMLALDEYYEDCEHFRGVSNYVAALP